MIVVSDTTVVTTLLKAGMEALLRELFGNVAIPQAVWDELLAFHLQLPNSVLFRGLEQDRRPPETASLFQARGVPTNGLTVGRESYKLGHCEFPP